MMNRRIGWLSRGFSLLEVLIVILVVAFGIVAVVKLQGLMVQDTGFNREQTIALSLAEQKLEDFRVFASMAGEEDSYAAISSQGGGWQEEQIQLKVVTFNRKWRVIHSLEHGESSDYKEIEVIVSWQDASGADREVQVSSVIAGISPQAMLSLLARYSEEGERIRPYDRSLLIPQPARNMGDHSLYTPPGSTIDIEIDNTSGQVTGGLDWLPAADSAAAVYLVNGYIEVIERPAPSVMQSLQLLLVNSANNNLLPQQQCWSDAMAYAPTATLSPRFDGYITYTCAVQSNTQTEVDGELLPSWSGSLRLQVNDAPAPDFGWAAKLASSDGNNPKPGYYKVCRFNHTPASYSQVHDLLVNQNYRLFDAGNNANTSCSAGTQQHQP